MGLEEKSITNGNQRRRRENMPRKKTAKVKQYKSIQTATTGRRQKGSVASRRVSTAVSRASKSSGRGGRGGRGGSAGGPGSLGDIIIRTINGIATPLNTSSDRKKKKK